MTKSSDRPFIYALAMGLALAMPWAVAAAQDSTPAGHSVHGEVFNEGPRQAAYLMGGTGRVRFPVSARSERVRALVAQGLGQLHGFWYFEAERSFRQAAALEPSCAISYWGMASANINNEKRAREFIARAVERREEAGDHERMYIDALSTFLRTGAELEAEKDNDKRREKEKSRRTAYVRSLERIIFKFPDDIEAKALLVVQLWFNSSHGLPITSHAAADALLEQVFRAEPMHPAHHYRIHLWDNERSEAALGSAALCGQSAPGIAHMWHMSGHIFSKLHRYTDAAWQQEASARVDHAHMMRDRVLPDQIHNFAHNNEWLIGNLIFVGRARDAVELAKNMLELPRHPKHNTYARGSARMGRDRLYEALESYELWEELIALSHTEYLEPTGEEADDIRRLRRLGAAQFRRGDAADGDATMAEIEALRARLKDDEEKAVDEAAAKVLAAASAPPPLPPEALPVPAPAPSPAPVPTPAPAPSIAPVPSIAPAADPPAESGPSAAPVADAAGAGAAAPPAAAAGEPAAGETAAAATAAAAENARAEARKPFASRVERLDKALAELKGHRTVALGDVSGGIALLKDAGGSDSLYLARLRLQVGEADAAESSLRAEVAARPGQVLPLAHLAETLWQSGRVREAAIAFSDLRALATDLDLGVPVCGRLSPLARALGLEGDWRSPRPMLADVGVRPPLDSLGPFRWQPPAAPAWRLVDASGEEHTLAALRGRPLVLVFFLGHGCLHCVEQLQAFAPRTDDFTAAGLALYAVSTDAAADLGRATASFGKAGFPFPLLADPKLDVFKAYRAFDDFESRPLHGTFLIDAEGLVRWHDISYEPFMDPAFVLKEWQRLRLGGQPTPAPSTARRQRV